MRTDFENLPEGRAVILHPSEANLLHRKPVRAERQGFYIFAENDPAEEGPSYSMRDVSAFCRGWEEA